MIFQDNLSNSSEFIKCSLYKPDYWHVQAAVLACTGWTAELYRPAITYLEHLFNITSIIR